MSAIENPLPCSFWLRFTLYQVEAGTSTRSQLPASRITCTQNTKETTMKLRGMSQIPLLLSIAVLIFGFAGVSASRAPAALHKSEATEQHCTHVGGMIMTNFGAIDQNTTMGTATGDLRGAVSGTILGAPQPGAGNTLVFHVQHHWVTESGDTLFLDPATATTVPLSQTLFAIVTYPVHLKGGTGNFAGATGDLTGIGEVDLNNGTVFRYSGQVCFGEKD
jgi:hypothetical protein